MEALLFTIALLAVVAGALVVLARSWPRSSRLGGYRAGRGAGRDEAGGQAGEDHVAEDDDVHWRWRDEDR